MTIGYYMLRAIYLGLHAHLHSLQVARDVFLDNTKNRNCNPDMHGILTKYMAHFLLLVLINVQ